MDKWEEVLVNDVAESIQYGYTGKTIETGTYRYLRITDIQNQKVNWEGVPLSDIDNPKDIEKYLLKENDIVFARTGATVGKSFIIKEVVPAIFASYLIRIQPNEKVYPEYLYQYFQSEDYWQQIRGHEVGAAQPNVNGKKLGLLKIPLPPIEKQQQIVAKLEALFERIDKSIALLEQNIENTKDLMASVLDEEFRKIKAPLLSVKELCINPKNDMVGGPFGSNLKSNEYQTSGFPIIRLQNVNRFRFLEKNIQFVSAEKADFLSSHSYKSGDIVMTKLGDPLGKCCIVNNVANVDRGIISSDIIRIRIDEKKHYKPYVVAGINSGIFIEQLTGETQGTTRPRVTLKGVREMKLPIPPKSEQINIANKIDNIIEDRNKLIHHQSEKLNHLKALKSSLLDKAFKGELV